MFKPYRVYTYISVDDKPATLIEYVGYGLTEDDVPRVVATSFTFEDVFHDLLPTPAVRYDKTLFFKKPYVEVVWSWCDVSRYYHFDHITIERHYKPWDDVTLSDLITSIPAERCIEYLKERGITAYPIVK